MDSVRERLGGTDRERAWLAVFFGGVAALVAGALFLPRLVWDRFLWQYYWGPVEADAKGARAAVLENGDVELYETTCDAIGTTAVCAEPGYTTVSTVSYMLVLVFMLYGVYLLARRWELGENVRIYYALVPFMLLGGALRAVEDSFVAALDAGVTPPLEYPVSALLISPLIYVVIFLLTLGALLVAMALEDRGVVEEYEVALGAFGVALLTITLGYLGYLGLTREFATLYPQMSILVVGIATVLSYVIWRYLIERYPDPVATIEYAGFFVIWGHAVDGVANVLSADWLGTIGVVGPDGQPLAYFPKHVVNRAIIDITESVQPEAVSSVIGTSWPFLAVKLIVASLVLWLFTDEFMEDSPRYALLLLIAITAVGLGPGTRDFIRVTLGI